MNSFEGNIAQVRSHQNLSLVTVDMGNDLFIKTILLGNKTASYLQEGNSVNVQFKETEVVLTTENPGAIGIENKIRGVVAEIELGVLLGRVCIVTSIGNIICILSRESLDELKLIPNSKVIAMIKVNEITLGYD